jgi:mono/diheme cytochrome c family protein
LGALALATALVAAGWGLPVHAADDKPAAASEAALPDTRMRSPEEELKTIELEPGYRLDLLASEPEVVSPTLCVWDGNGRMYVAEMRTYMRDINGLKQHVPASRVSRWEDTDGDGVYDKHTIFADKLVLPRMVLPLDDRVLIRETGTKDIYCYRDTDGDGVADQKERVYEGGKQEGNLEHQPSGLMWNLDNWIYVTHQKERFRFTRGKIEKEAIPFDKGQWGLAMDDTGRLIFATAGNERPAHNFQVMPQYGEIDLPGQLADGFTEVFPLTKLTDVEGGTKRLKPGGGLNVFTACAGGSVYRGEALPLYGQYILPEPVGRLVRRAYISDLNGKAFISSGTAPETEFIRSSDANFRPVWSATGPDGLLYLCDMYRGIIQEANWTKQGTYLRPQIQKYGLEKNIDGGRIWRLSHKDYPRPARQPRMLDETPAQLVEHLRDPNGWWRDTAQKLIVLRGDKSVVPALREMARSDGYPIARLHALWTLEGLDSVDGELLVEKLKDDDARLRQAAVRIAEPPVKKGDATVTAAVKERATDADGRVAAQACLSMLYVGSKDADGVIAAAVANQDRIDKKNNTPGGLVRVYRQNVAKAKEIEDKKKAMELANPKLAAVYEKGRGLYGQTCIACHAADGMGTPGPERNGTRIAPPLKGSARLQGDKRTIARIVINGLTGAHDGGKTYPQQMPSFKWADDQWLSAILTYARNDWGNKADIVEPEDVATIRTESAGREKPFTLEELAKLLPAAVPAPAAPAAGAVVAGKDVVPPAQGGADGGGASHVLATGVKGEEKAGKGTPPTP